MIFFIFFLLFLLFVRVYLQVVRKLYSVAVYFSQTAVFLLLRGCLHFAKGSLLEPESSALKLIFPVAEFSQYIFLTRKVTVASAWLGIRFIAH